MRTQKFAKKSLGQNFLNNPLIRDQILEEAGDISGKKILEIGPGLGFLTSALIKANANLTAIEFDPRAVKILTEYFGHLENFRLISGNFLEQDLDIIFEQNNYSIIANIPYNITGPIFRKVLEKTKNKPQFTIFMVQKEVAQKICPPLFTAPQAETSKGGIPTSSKKTKARKKFKRSILSISVEIFAQAKYCFTVSRENFSPVPRVDSAIIRLDIRDNPLVPKALQVDFFTVVNGGFSEKRKKIGNVIGKFFGFSSADLLGDIDPNRRAETLDVPEWLEITKNFQKLK